MDALLYFLWFCLGFFIAWVLAGWLFIGDRKKMPWTKAPVPSSAALGISKLLRGDPEGWERGSHSWHHAGANLTIWVGNADYGLAWWVGPPHPIRNEAKPPEEDRQCVWETIRPMMTGTTQDVANRALAALRTAPIQQAATVVHLRPRGDA